MLPRARQKSAPTLLVVRYCASSSQRSSAIEDNIRPSESARVKRRKGGFSVSKLARVRDFSEWSTSKL